MIPMLVCFVEDSDLDFELGRMAIQMENPLTKILRAKCCQEGMKIVEDNTPQLTILDLNLPGCDGFRILKHIAKSIPDQLRRIVVFTTSSNPKDRAMALELGVCDFQTKSSDPEEYLKTVRRMMSLSSN